MIRAVSRWIRSLFGRSSQDAPAVNLLTPPLPDEQQQFFTPGIQPIERHFERHIIPGTSIELGWQERALLIHDELVNGQEVLHALLGCKHAVAQFEATKEPGRVIRGVGGMCPFCQDEAAKALVKGEITPYQAETLSLFCTECARRCDGCGLASVCSRHCLPFANPDGSQLVLCPACRTSADRQRLVSRVFQIIASPFIEPEDTQCN